MGLNVLECVVSGESGVEEELIASVITIQEIVNHTASISPFVLRNYFNCVEHFLIC